MNSSVNRFRLYGAQEWRTASLLFVGYLAVYAITAYFVPDGIPLYPAAGVALAGLFFGGLRLWPVVLLASIVGGLYAELALPLLVITALAEVAQAALGAHVLRSLRIDPLFRRYRDTFYMIMTAVVVSTIVPSLAGITRRALELPLPGMWWLSAYVAMLASLIIIVPFLLRWFTKPRFSRTLGELTETIAIFTLLLVIDVALFVYDVRTVLDIPLLYFLAFPLFWIALRLRPRFVSLALLLTALCVVGSELSSGTIETLAARLYEAEAFLILIAMSFFTIVSLEEDRRVNTNLMRSQLSTLENAVARVSSESGAKNDFIAILAHELRNPLAPIVSAIDLLKLKGARDDEERETLAVMENRMETVRRLLDDLLDISRITEGKMALKHEPVDLESIIRRAIMSTEHHIKERHQALILKFPKKRKFVMGDAVRLEQVFSNLLTNASKYSNSGDTIILKMQRIDTQVEVAITDEGIGIHPSDLGAIFTPFHQVEEGGRGKKGLGIGLALVKSFVEMHGGTVRAESTGEGKGSRFIVQFPLLPETTPATPAETKVERVSAPKHAGLSVLVVDDNDAAAAGIGRLLELRGCSVAYAYDGAQGIEKVEEFAPEVVLLDVGLPDQDGYSVAKVLRAHGYTGRLIALTGFSTDDARAKGMEAGFDAYLIKPAGFSDLQRVIPELG